MIKINLCPVDELESPYPFLPDAVTIAVVALAAWFGVTYYLDGIRDEIAKVNESAQSYKESADQLQPDIERFNNLQTDIAKLNQRLGALRAITVSKISKYKPVIVIEHLQNLKPEGAWFHSLNYGTGTDPDAFEIKGSAFDNILTAELITALRATESQEPDEGDMRTQVYFNTLVLGSTAHRQAAETFLDLNNVTDFTITGVVRERVAGMSTEAAHGKTVSRADDGRPGDVRF